MALKMTEFPSDYFLEHSEKYLISRYASFLLQSLLMLVRVFEIPSLLKNKFGEGLLTVPRYALFLCRTELLTNPAATRILSRLCVSDVSMKSRQHSLIPNWPCGLPAVPLPRV